MTQVSQPSSAAMQPNGYLGLQANIPMPKPPVVPRSPKMLPIGLGSQRIQSVSGDSLRERRESSIRAATPSQVSTPVSPAGVRGGGQ